MIKLASELLLKPIVAKREGAAIGLINDLVVNPDDGGFIGIIVREGFGKNNLKTLAVKDIITISSDFILIPSYDVVGEIDEIVRIKSIIDQDIKIAKTTVVTIGGKILGKVRDYSIHLKTDKLEKIYVNPPMMRPFAQEYIISLPQIVSIEKEQITVEDTKISTRINSPGLITGDQTP